MLYTKTLVPATIAFACFAGSAIADEPVLRATVLEYGTVNWELDTIQNQGLDTANGFDLEVSGVAGSDAAQIAFLAGETDAIVTDWLWVARQRAVGEDIIFIPYSKAVGGLLVAEDSTAETLADLDGAKIGIAGGPLDKSWLILRAYAQNEYDMDLVAQTEQVFGAPPLISETALNGDLDGAINFWHWSAKMQASGMRTLIEVSTAAESLGLDPETPLLGYAVHGEMLTDSPDLIYGLVAASREAKALLATDDSVWEDLRGRMRPANEAQFEALKAGFIAGIPSANAVDEAAVARMMQLMIDLGGSELVGEMTELPEGIFVQPRE